MSIRFLTAAAFAVIAAACSQEQTTHTTVATETANPATAAVETTATTAAAQGDSFTMPAKLETTPSGLQYSVDQPGTGPQPKQGQVVLVHYTGWLTDGTKFDSSRDRGTPLDFPVGTGRVIQGWDEGVGAMKVGEKRTLVIPPALGYGAEGSGSAIPPNSTLVFKVELVGIQ